jgi:hypothetical protein
LHQPTLPSTPNTKKVALHKVGFKNYLQQATLAQPAGHFSWKREEEEKRARKKKKRGSVAFNTVPIKCLP